MSSRISLILIKKPDDTPHKTLRLFALKVRCARNRLAATQDFDTVAAMAKTITGMKAGGYYDAHSSPQRDGMLGQLPHLLENLATKPLQPGPDGSIRMLDIGSSHGANVLIAANQIIDTLRTQTDAPIQTCYSDLPTNDYNQLSQNLFPNGDKYFAQPDVYVGAIPGSAFDRLAPHGSLQLVTTFNMLGWMSRKPESPITSYIFPIEPAHWIKNPRAILDPKEAEPYRAQSETDMVTFLRMRAAELAPGGKLLMQCFGRNKDVAVAHGMLDAFSDTLLDMIDEGIIERSLYESFNWPAYFRTTEELIKPLETEPDLAEAFTLEHAGWVETPISFNDALKATGDVATWSQEYTTFMRAFTEPVIAPCLPEQHRDALVDTFYDRLCQTLASDPENYACHYISIGALLTRK